jgi:hypothetical protein
MKKRILYIAAVLFLFSGISFGQSGNIFVQLKQPPPFKFHLEDMWKVTLTNPGDAISVYLFGTVSKNGQLLVDARSSAFNLPKGVKYVNAQEISPIDVNKYSDEVDKTITKTGSLPSGSYNICVFVYSSTTNLELGSFCGDYEVLEITKAELLSPQNEETVRDFMPSFNWLPPAPIPSGNRVSYEIKFVEILERQTGYYAMLANPAWFSQSNVTTTLFRYPLAARQFKNGVRYAWRVNTYTNGSLVSESEVWEFTYENVAQNVKATNNDFYNKYKGDTTRNVKLPLSDFKLPDINNNISLTGKNSSEVLLASNNTMFPLIIVEKPLVLIDSATKESWIKFNGSYKTEYTHYDKKPIGSDLPTNLGSISFDPTVSIYNIPFNINLYFDTQQDKLKQNINSFVFLLKPSMITDYIKGKIDEEIAKIKNKVEKELEEVKNKPKEELDKIKNNAEKEISNVKGKVSKWLSFFSYFKTLGLGENYPVYSANTVNGVKVTGADIEFNPGLFYIAFSGYKNLDAIADNTFGRNLLAGRIGIGAKDESHFHITMMKAWDRETSINLVNATTAPQENFLSGASAKLSLFKNAFEIEGEFVGSILTRDKTAPDLQIDDFPKFLQNFITPKISTSFDFMWEIKSKLNIEKTDTKIEGGFKSVGPGFTSLGAPGIRQDINSLNLSLSQSFIKKRIVLKVTMARDVNNVAGWNTNTTTYFKMGFNVKVNFPNLPFFMLDFRPNSMKNNAKDATMVVDNNANVLTFMFGYNGADKKNTNSINFMFSNQTSRSYLGANDYTISNYYLTDNIGFVEFPLTINASLGYTNTDAVGSTNIFTFDLGLGYTLFEVWNNSLGGIYSEEVNNNSKASLYFTSTTPITKYIDLNFYAEKSFYNERIYQYGNINDFNVRLTLSKSW